MPGSVGKTVITEHLQQVNSVSGLLKSAEIECDIRLERLAEYPYGSL
jgi:hypothetical protein